MRKYKYLFQELLQHNAYKAMNSSYLTVTWAEVLNIIIITFCSGASHIWIMIPTPIPI